jgi:hypothetical protein
MSYSRWSLLLEKNHSKRQDVVSMRRLWARHTNA